MSDYKKAAKAIVEWIKQDEANPAAREFSLCFVWEYTPISKFVDCQVKSEQPRPIPCDNKPLYIDVIEKSAYDALAKDNEELKAKYDGVFNQRMRFAQEITSLRDSLKLAVEALGLYADISNWMGIDGCEFDLIDHDKKTQGHGSCGVKARMTLAEITEKHGEITKGDG